MPPDDKRERQRLLPSLNELRRKEGFLSSESMGELADSLSLSIGDVFGTATFYSFFPTEPTGKHVIRICKSVPCHMQDAEMIIDAVQKELGINPGETSADKRFSFEQSRNWKEYEEQEFESYRKHNPPQSVKKPEIWKLYQFGQWLPEAMKKLDAILHNASVNSHFNFSTFGNHLDGDKIRKERGVEDGNIFLANVIEIIFLWLGLVVDCFSLEISENVEFLVKQKENLLVSLGEV